ncbi:hypothetical protein HG1285_15926 [Hydrogenivirga sp. 128-5-R1-1]|nr:hypothetical protein HG1285_15926 [Hydrogenivirga sp. 128-5-R1-1]
MNIDPIWLLVFGVALAGLFGLTMIKLEERKEKTSH